MNSCLKFRACNGFSLIELLVTVSIAAILLGARFSPSLGGILRCAIDHFLWTMGHRWEWGRPR